MSRPIFLTIASFIALSVGAFALLFPGVLLESKGVAPLAATSVWMRETGLLLLTLGIINFAVRKLKPSGTLKALLSGNIIIQIGLFVIELLAYSNDVITKLSGIIPNLILHILLAIGFVYFLKTMDLTTDNTEPK
ncbi:hypothetical protein GVN16_21280 [Emticicia sp. CRIBPO]|uniref:hypothetical protein n=1 Tax=Emticicia sp. CRIBPO TaxID=2683258 RepID=UPI0014131B3D|nr:hypothetical protein [Emticicia sp. CRIBPO]NBA88319.1 hypothetical protein [Emticicia sp. CRIBPO]